MGSPAKIILAIAVLVEVSGLVVGSPDTNITSVLCNSGVYTGGDPFATSLAYVLDDLIEAAPSSKGNDYYNISPFPISFAFGHAGCTANLTGTDCSTCLSAAVGSMNSTCVMTIGGRAVLHDCNVRYEQYPFVN